MTTAGAVRSYLRALLAAGRWHIALMLAVGIAAALSEGVVVVLLVPLLATAGVIGSGDPAALPYLTDLLPEWLGLGGVLALWAAIAAGHALLGAWRDQVSAMVQQRFAHRCRTRLFDAAAGMEWQAFTAHRSSDILHALTVLQAKIAVGAGQTLQFAVRVLLVLTYLAIAFVVEPRGGLLVVIGGCLLAVMQLPWIRRAIGHGRAEVAGWQGLHALVSDHLGGMQMAKAWGAEARQAVRFAAASSRLAEASRAALAARTRDLVALRVAQAVLVAVGLWLALSWLGLRGAPLLLIAAVPIRLLPVFVGLVHALRAITETLPAWMQAETLLRRYLDAAEPAPPSGHPPTGAIILRGIGFVWPTRNDQPAIADVALTIQRRRTTALVGPSGAGKSTLAQIVLGLLVPTRGTVRVGETLLGGEARRAWRSAAAYVPQDVFLLHDTVRANLAWAQPDAGEAAMWQCLEDAAIADLVRALPNGLDTVLGDRGAAVSGGERQRLAIAQALLRRPELLVLDEATSHLDPDNERAVQEALRRLHGRVTVLLIAHRLSTVRDADHIVVLERGRVVEEGTWQALMQRTDGALRRLAGTS